MTFQHLFLWSASFSIEVLGTNKMTMMVLMMHDDEDDDTDRAWLKIQRTETVSL